MTRAISVYEMWAWMRRCEKECQRLKRMTPEELAKIPDKPRWYTQTCACPKCNTLNWADHSEEYHLMMDEITFECHNCGEKWVEKLIKLP